MKDEQKDPLRESSERSLDLAKSSANSAFSKCPAYTAHPSSLTLPAQSFGPLRLGQSLSSAGSPITMLLHTHFLCLTPIITDQSLEGCQSYYIMKFLRAATVLFSLLCLAPKLSACNIGGVQQMFVEQMSK